MLCQQNSYALLAAPTTQVGATAVAAPLFCRQLARARGQVDSQTSKMHRLWPLLWRLDDALLTGQPNSWQAGGLILAWMGALLG